jgi:hypothetical protein
LLDPSRALHNDEAADHDVHGCYRLFLVALPETCTEAHLDGGNALPYLLNAGHAHAAVRCGAGAVRGGAREERRAAATGCAECDEQQRDSDAAAAQQQY